MSGIAKFDIVALDTRDPVGLARFYSDLTGLRIEKENEGWVQLSSDGGATLAFQLVPDHEPPQWPDPSRPQQVHLDFLVDDLDRTEAEALAIGARKAEVQPGQTWRVFLDPAGHPFCLCLIGA